MWRTSPTAGRVKNNSALRLQRKTLKMASPRILKTCSKGHQFYKRSDCPTCPICEMQMEPATGFLAMLSSPARNTLLYHGIDTIDKLSAYSEKQILRLHGIGKASLPVFRAALAAHGLSFKTVADIDPPSRSTDKP